MRTANRLLRSYLLGRWAFYAHVHVRGEVPYDQRMRQATACERQCEGHLLHEDDTSQSASQMRARS